MNTNDDDALPDDTVSTIIDVSWRMTVKGLAEAGDPWAMRMWDVVVAFDQVVRERRLTTLAAIADAARARPPAPLKRGLMHESITGMSAAQTAAAVAYVMRWR